MPPLILLEVLLVLEVSPSEAQPGAEDPSEGKFIKDGVERALSLLKRSNSLPPDKLSP
jgi:hypothetical protein